MRKHTGATAMPNRAQNWTADNTISTCLAELFQWLHDTYAAIQF